MKKAKYMVRFDFLNENGEWKPDYLSNNDNGFDRADAEYIVQDLNRRDTIKEARMVAMSERSCEYER